MRFYIYIICCCFVTSSVLADSLDVEYHFQICDTSRDEIISGFDFDKDDYKNKKVIYFDTKDLKILENRRVIRLRINQRKDKADITVKLRPVYDIDRWKSWLGEDFFKCEYDQFVNKNKLSCSIKQHFKIEDAEDFLDGKISLKKLLTKQQYQLLTADGLTQKEFNNLSAFGPVNTFKYKGKLVKHQKLEFDMYMLDHYNIFELSFRDSKNSKDVSKIIDQLKDLNIKLCPQQTSKTRQILNPRVL